MLLFLEQEGQSLQQSNFKVSKDKSIFSYLVESRQDQKNLSQYSNLDLDQPTLVYEEIKDDLKVSGLLHRPCDRSAISESLSSEDIDFKFDDSPKQRKSYRRMSEMQDRTQLKISQRIDSQSDLMILPETTSPPESDIASDLLEQIKEISKRTEPSNASQVEIINQNIMEVKKFNYKFNKKSQTIAEIHNDSDSSQSWLSDKSYNSQNYKPVLIQPSPLKALNHIAVSFSQGGIGQAFHDELLKPKQIEIVDALQLVTISEQAYQKYAERRLQETKRVTIQTAKILTSQAKQKTLHVQRVLQGPKQMRQISQSFQKRQQEGIIATCITVSIYSLIVGTSAGIVFVYDKDTEKFHSLFREDSKEFTNNAVTAIDVHPLRPEYVVSGHQRGQLVLLDLTKLPMSPSSLKLVKDHHKNPVVCVKFCDWIKEKPIDEDKSFWMIVSCCTLGKIIITKISNPAFRFLNAEKLVILDPVKLTQQPNFKYQTIASRFFDKRNPKDQINDNVTLIALGSTEDVVIEIIDKDTNIRVFRIARPKYYVSDNQNNIIPINPQLPCIAWGEGRTPNHKDQTNTLLAISWGPLIQVVCLVDIRKRIGQQFVLDGHYIIAPATMYAQPNGLEDPYIQQLAFLDESLLVSTLSTNDIRVLYTKVFYPSSFQEPKPNAKISMFQSLDARSKMVSLGIPLTIEQNEIELERRTQLESPICQSMFGANCSQTAAVSNGRIVFLCQSGIVKLMHLTWEESLGNLDPQLMEGNNWIDMFAKALGIYLGKIKGLRNVADDDLLRRDLMKGQIKIKISEIVEVVIQFWRKQAQTDFKSGKSKENVKEDLNRNLQTLIRIIIELSVEIDEADFLFTDVYQRFKDLKCGEMFAAEIQPYILSGLFSDWEAPEHILNFHILQHHQTVFQEAYHTNASPTHSTTFRAIPPAENFEKVLISLRFDQCSKNNIQDLIEFCKKYRLSTGVIHLCINTMGEQGPVQALTFLRDFYTEALTEEQLQSKSITWDQIKQLVNIPANSSERLPLERSAIYIGFKLIWATKLFIKGNKFPKGKFDKNQLHNVCHLVLKLISQPDFMITLCQIDASAYFQIIALAFNVQMIQHSIVKKGGLVSHLSLLTQITYLCMSLQKGDPVRIAYLCFIASHSSSNLINQDRNYFLNIVIELLEYSQSLIDHNEMFLSRQTQTQIKLLSPKAFTSPQSQSIILSEEQLTQLIRRSEHLTSADIDQIVEHLKPTQFSNLKVVMYEKQEDYIKCLNMQIESQNMTQRIQDCFTWIIKVYYSLERRAGEHNKEIFQNFHNEVKANVIRLVNLDAHKSVGLCEAIFNSEHESYIKWLCNPSSQFVYINKLIELKSDTIKLTIKQYKLFKTDEKQASQWLRILIMHMQLTSQLNPQQIMPLLKQVDCYYPLEECLMICIQDKHYKESAFLCNRLGKYKESIQFYIQYLNCNLVLKDFRKEIFYFSRHGNINQLTNLKLFQQTLKKILKICSKHPEEALVSQDSSYKLILQTISSIIYDSKFLKKSYCKMYLFKTMQHICRQLLGYVTFSNIIEIYMKSQPQIQYKELHTIISEVFLDRKQQILLYKATNKLILHEYTQRQNDYQVQNGFKILKCSICDKSKSNIQFQCCHSYHSKCLTVYVQKQEDSRLRCIVCQPVSHDISELKPTKIYPIKIFNSQRSGTNSGKSDRSSKSNSSHTSSSQGSSSQSRFQFYKSALAIEQQQSALVQAEKKRLDQMKKMKVFNIQLNQSETRLQDFKWP